MRNDLSIGMRAERMAARGELVPKLLVVVDLAVEDDMHRAELVSQRLRAALEVDDGQPPHPERDVSVLPEALPVGSAVSHRSDHPAQDLGFGARAGGEDACYAAHSPTLRTPSSAAA